MPRYVRQDGAPVSITQLPEHDHPASAVSFSDSGLIVVNGNNVQSALEGVDAALADRMTTQQVEDGLAEVSHQKLDELDLGSVAGTGGLLTIPGAVRGTFRSYQIRFYGGLATDSFGTVLTVRVNDDSGANYRSVAQSVRADTGAQVDSFTGSGIQTPRTSFIGSLNGGMAVIDLMPASLGDTGIMGWSSHAYINSGASDGQMLLGRGGGRWNGTGGPLESFRVRSPANSDEFSSNAYAVLYGLR